jgi:hypothetical protein
MDDDRLCAVRGCPHEAAFVPFFRAYGGVLHTPERAAVSAPLSTLAHCAEHKAQTRRLADILGDGYMARIGDEFVAHGKRRPVRFELDWLPVSRPES